MAESAPPAYNKLLAGFYDTKPVETELGLDEPLKRQNAVTPREGFLFSVVIHMLLFIVLLVKPDLFAPRKMVEARKKPEPRERLVMVDLPPRALLPAPKAQAPAPPGKQQQPPLSSGMIIPKAAEPPPPSKRQDFQNDLPFSEGNTDEFYADKESKKPGEKGQGVERMENPDEPVPPEPEERVASLPPGRFSFSTPRPIPPLRPVPRPPAPDPGDNGEGGAFQDLRRFLRDKQFHNPEGGLVTGNRTLYYNDKGANFVPWIMRMLAEVRRNWIVPISASYEMGHVAVGVSVERDGTVSDMKILVPSQTIGFDNAATGALRASQLLPLPSDYPDQQFDFILVFWYNERPYDIFN